MNTRLAKRGPYVLGTRFSLADFYLSFWVAYLDREGVCKQFTSIAKLYDLVRSRPSAIPYLEGTERMAEAYADMMKRIPEASSPSRPRQPVMAFRHPMPSERR